MLKVEVFMIDKIKLYTLKLDQEELVVYNEYNNKMILTETKFYDYVQKNYLLLKDSPLHDFLYSKKKKKILEFQIFKVDINISKLNKILPVFKYLNSKMLVVISILMIFFNSKNNVNSNEEIIFNYDNLKTVIFLVICQFIISGMHELSHLYVYSKNIDIKKVSMGISLRYLCLPLIFINVPFMNYMKKDSKLALISAGIKCQIIILGVSSLIGIFFYNEYLTLFNIMNLSIIILNGIPFLKMDGYWYISTLLSVDDYMETYFSYFLKKAKVSKKIMLIGTLNICIIFLTVIYNIHLVIDYVIRG